ncbi:hypothetical protein DOTSEDRAFT_73317 [Dothistroma septosporum NZE10]|uniref:Uncharacterized protein n=1 Tax=Dothistroma septosporum (strain NZE10 / CBS 128990) TaxID=675120 RepID=N1PLL6_DOTSN|nr:hypothetical protein DOTSEDRAFT_73317 [Dothistroma septosporum NZE10]
MRSNGHIDMKAQHRSIYTAFPPRPAQECSIHSWPPSAKQPAAKRQWVQFPGDMMVHDGIKSGSESSLGRYCTSGSVKGMVQSPCHDSPTTTSEGEYSLLSETHGADDSEHNEQHITDQKRQCLLQRQHVWRHTLLKKKWAIHDARISNQEPPGPTPWVQTTDGPPLSLRLRLSPGDASITIYLQLSRHKVPDLHSL